MLPQAAEAFYTAQQRRTVATLALVRREWASMGPDLEASWAVTGPRVALLVASAQLGAARDGAVSVPAVLTELGGDVEPLAQVQPSAFAGVAADGRPLASLLYGAVVVAKQWMAIDVLVDGFRAEVSGGATVSEALAVGGRSLDMYVHTTVADAGRQAQSVAITTRPHVQWVRFVNLPCCSRCAILAGRVYRWSHGFKRHPRCDCNMLPQTVANPLPDELISDPGAILRTGQVTDLTIGQREALANGADPYQVVNARRKGAGMTTTEGTTRRGLAGSRNSGRQRLTPDGINRIASDRTQAVELLKQHGYVT